MARCGCTSGCACTIHHADTNCVGINITGSGSGADPYIISPFAKISLDAGNTISCHTDGLFVPTPDTQHFAVAAGSCLTITGTGSLGDPFTFHTTAQEDDIEVFAISGPLVAPTIGTLRFRFPFAATIIGFSAAVNTAPTGTSIILDVNQNGASIFSINPKPTILVGAFDTGVSEVTPDTTAIVSGDYLQIDVDQVGSIIPGSDLTVFVHYTKLITC